MKTRIFLTLGAAALAAILSASALAQSQQGPKLYKWVDKQGVTHYGSSVPPQYADQQLQVLNSQGMTVKTLAAPKTPEQLAAEKQQQATAAQETEEQKKQHATDQMLLDTYTSVADIEQDRKTRAKAMDAQITVTNSAIASLEGNLKTYKKQQEVLTKNHKPIPESLRKDLSNTDQQLAADRKLLDQQTQQKQAMEARFDGYAKRFQELSKAQNGSGG